MILLDVNVLINAVNTDSPLHVTAKRWMEAKLHAGEKIAIPWAVLKGFVRITTNARIIPKPLTLDEALQTIEGWVSLSNVSILHPTDRHMEVFTSLCRASNATGNLITDAHLAALAVEHGIQLASSDADFARFPGLQWINPFIG